MSRIRPWLAVVSTCLVTLGCEPAAPPPQTTPPAPQVAAPAPVEQPEVARAGVAKQGQSLREESGVGRMIAQPAITFFTVRERAVFEIQIPKSKELWKATSGRDPKSHEEFMDQIIKPNMIKLPELPAGKTYRYHPEDGQLYVHPAE